MTKWTQADIDEFKARQAAQVVKVKPKADKTVKPKKTTVKEYYNTVLKEFESELLIGIDTGKNTGFSIYDRNSGTLIEVECYLIHQVMERFIGQEFNGKKVFVYVEDARQAVHGRGSAIDANKAQGAGSVKRDATIWFDFLTEHGIPFHMVRPNKSSTKLDAATFKKVTGWQGRTNSHGRDAAMIVFKRTIK
jgi:hypothetical protein